MICLMITLLLAFGNRYRAIKGEGIKILALENATRLPIVLTQARKWIWSSRNCLFFAREKKITKKSIKQYD